MARVNRNDRAITALVMLGHGMVHTYEMSIPIFVSIWLVEFEPVALGSLTVGITEATLGVVVTAGFALFGIGALPGGVLVDRIGSSQLITLCLFGMAGSFLLLSVAPGLVVVTLALVLWGAAASVYHPAGLTLISKGIQDRGTGFAYHGVVGNVGIGLWPLFTTILLLAFEWTTVAGLLAIPALIAGVYAIRAEFDGTAAVSADGGESKASASVDSLSEFLGESRHLFTSAFIVVFVVVVASGLYYRGVTTFLPELLGDLPGFEPIAISTLVPERARRARRDQGGPHAQPGAVRVLRAAHRWRLRTIRRRKAHRRDQGRVRACGRIQRPCPPRARLPPRCGARDESAPGR
jgi:MFS family permease